MKTLQIPDLARPVDRRNVLSNTPDTLLVLIPHALVFIGGTVRRVEEDETVRALDAGHPVCRGALVTHTTQPVLKDALLATVTAPDIVARPAPHAVPLRTQHAHTVLDERAAARDRPVVWRERRQRVVLVAHTPGRRCVVAERHASHSTSIWSTTARLPRTHRPVRL